MEVIAGFKERYEIEVHTVGFDKNHVHVLCRFLTKYSGGQVVRLMKSITALEVFREGPQCQVMVVGRGVLDRWILYCTVSGRGDKKVIEEYIKNQGRKDEVKQLRLFEL